MAKKRILITGKGSYVGTSFIKWVSQWPDEYEVDEISVRGEEWKQYDFSRYDSILHVAGIAHVSADPKMEQEYYRVNRDLAIAVAEKAKREKVKQFIFMSSIIVYGDSGKVGQKKVISKNTVPQPSNFYGDSKLQAEYGIKELEDLEFAVAIIRPPMIYGYNSKGNYSKLSRVARFSPLFPKINNERSVLFVNNLSEFLKQIVDLRFKGVFYPQDSQYVSTSQLVELIAKTHKKKIYSIRLFNPIINLLAFKFNFINKIFGNLVYDKSLSELNLDYCIADLKEAIKIAEGKIVI